MLAKKKIIIRLWVVYL